MHSKNRGGHMKAKHLMKRAGYASKGDVVKAVHEHEKSDHPGHKLTNIKLKTGGAVEGKASGGRLDKLARGGAHMGKKKPHVVVNVMNHPQTPIASSIPPIPGGMPMGGPKPMPGPAPIGAGAPGMPAGGPGLPPGAMKRGGRTAEKCAEGGEPTQGYSKGKIAPPKAEAHLKKGGKVPHMTGGAGSGVGREEKAEQYGTKPKAK